MIDQYINEQQASSCQIPHEDVGDSGDLLFDRHLTNKLEFDNPMKRFDTFKGILLPAIIIIPLVTTQGSSGN